MTRPPIGPAGWRELEPLLDRAYDLPAEERQGWLKTLEPGLREELVALLEAERREGPLDRPAAALAAGTGATGLETGATPTTRFGHYRLIRKLGAGGMGIVYEAEDLRLGRHVALKTVPTAIVEPSARARFEREARSLAQLNHPNIVTIHSIEFVDDQPALVMELVDGETLTSAIPPEGFDVGDGIEIAAALTDAVAYAHGRGVLHRDLKPSNVMRTPDGQVKVLDFGLARLQTEFQTAGTTEFRTAQGTVVGTFPYMSPEQAEGRDSDHRSDQFSLGCLLYEIFAGVRAFRGNSSGEILAGILTGTPPSLASQKPDLPAKVVAVIERCLEKDPDGRFPETSELAAALAEQRDLIHTPRPDSTGSPPKPSSSAAPSGGPRSPARRTRRWVAGAAWALVATALTLWMALAGRLDTGRVLDEAPEEASPGQADGTTVDGSSGRTSPGEAAVGLAAEVSDPPRPAELAYLRGWAHSKRPWGYERWFEAIEAFEEATELDPSFGPAWASLSIYRGMVLSQGIRRGKSLEQQTAEVQEALEQGKVLDPDGDMTRLAAGYAAYYLHRDFESAFTTFREVAEEAPDDFRVHRALGAIQRRRGEYDQTIHHWETVLKLAPDDLNIAVDLARVYSATRQFERTVRHLDQLIRQLPEEPSLLAGRAWAEVCATGSIERARGFLALLPDGEDAIPELHRLARDYPAYLRALETIRPDSGIDLPHWLILAGAGYRWQGNETAAQAHLKDAVARAEEVILESGRHTNRAVLFRALALAHLGREREARQVVSSLAGFTAADSWVGPRFPATQAQVLMLIGDLDRAVVQLEQVLETAYSDALCRWQLRLDPTWDPLRDHPGFQRLIEQPPAAG